MKYFDLIRVALGNLKGNKLRSLLTILGISIGIGAIVFLVAFGYGLQKLTIDRLTSSSAVTTIDVSPAASSVLKLDDDSLKRFANLDNVEIVSAVASFPGQITLESTTTDVVILGVEQNYFKLEQPKFSSGRSFFDKTEVIISDSAAKLFSINNSQDALDKEISLDIFVPTTGNGQAMDKKNLQLKISGVIENASPVAYIDLTTIKSFDIKEFSQTKVKVSSAEQVEGIKAKISEIGFQASSVSDVISEINNAFRIIQYVLAGFGLIAFLVASIGMFNTMTIALLERTKDIGVMKALGAKNRDIKKIFIAESVVISVSGGIVGILIAYVLSAAINIFVNVLARQTGSTKLDIFVFPWQLLAFVMIFSVVIGIITGIYPARRASKLNPLNALRYE